MNAHAVSGHRYVDLDAGAGERNLAACMHLASYAYVFLPVAFLIPMVIWLARKDDSPLLDDHGCEALNFHISLMLYILLSIPLVIAFGLGLILLLVVIPLVWLILPAIAAAAASKGEYYRYPMVIRFLKPAA